MNIQRKNSAHHFRMQSEREQTLGPVGIWSPKSSTFSGSDSIVVGEAARKFLSPRPSIKKPREENSSCQNDKA